MTRAFVDSSVLLAMAFNEAGAVAMRARLRACDVVFASPLVEAEVCSAARREHRILDRALLLGIRWIHPERELSSEIRRVLEAGYVRGADCWHLATALYFVTSPADIVFLTLDKRQQDVATALGFAT